MKIQKPDDVLSLPITAKIFDPKNEHPKRTPHAVEAAFQLLGAYDKPIAGDLLTLPQTTIEYFPMEEKTRRGFMAFFEECEAGPGLLSHLLRDELLKRDHVERLALYRAALKEHRAFANDPESLDLDKRRHYLMILPLQHAFPDLAEKNLNRLRETVMNYHFSALRQKDIDRLSYREDILCGDFLAVPPHVLREKPSVAEVLPVIQVVLDRAHLMLGDCVNVHPNLGRSADDRREDYHNHVVMIPAPGKRPHPAIGVVEKILQDMTPRALMAMFMEHNNDMDAQTKAAFLDCFNDAARGAGQTTRRWNDFKKELNATVQYTCKLLKDGSDPRPK